MARFKKPQADHVADTRGGGWIGLPRAVADSPAYLALDPFERAVFAEILRAFKGFNNGNIVIGYADIGARLQGRNAGPPNNGRIARAIARLVDHGLVVPGDDYYWKERKAREYRLTFISSGKGPPFRPATNDYLKWKPREKIVGNGASPEHPQAGNGASPRDNQAGNGASPDNLKNGSFALSADQAAGDGESLLIGKPYPPTNSEGDDPQQITPLSGAGLADDGAVSPDQLAELKRSIGKIGAVR